MQERMKNKLSVCVVKHVQYVHVDVYTGAFFNQKQNHLL